MTFPFLALSAVVPSLLLMWYFHARDIFPEPPRALWAVFGLGVLIVIPVLLVAWPFGGLVGGVASPLVSGALAAFLQAAIPEEAFKFLVVWRYAARRPEFDEPMDGVVYGVAASLGFATFENLAYVADSGLGVAVMRALTAVPSHAFLGAIMGYYVGRARFVRGEERNRWLMKAFIIPVLLHGVYDFPLLAGVKVRQLDPSDGPLVVALVSIAPLVVVGEWIWAMRLSRSLRLAQVRNPSIVAEGRSAAPGRLSSVILTAGGAVAASLGGLMALGLALVLLLGRSEADQVGTLAAGVVLLGLTPLAAGTAVFAWGITRLNESGRRTGRGNLSDP
ncbi:MAG: PrsW family glutamic-type intramembrane protease [Thermoanaerobaculia bacterium]